MSDVKELSERMDRLQDEVDALWGMLQRAELLVDALERGVLDQVTSTAQAA